MECNVEANIVGNKMPYYKNCNNWSNKYFTIIANSYKI